MMDPREQRLEIEQLPYFHFKLHRLDVAEVLEEDGDFILRQIQQDGFEYAISIRWKERVRTFPVVKDRRQWCFEAKPFDTIRRLLEWHMSTGTPITDESGARIRRPMDRKPWEILSKDIEKKGPLGRGNFGTVFAAVINRRTAAVKTLDMMSSQNKEKIEEARIEMLNEARIMRAVSGQQNIVEAIGVTIDEELPSVVLELVRGKTLDKLRQELNQLQMGEKVRLAGEAAAGLTHVHSKGYLHRDMAARNCIVEMTAQGLGRLKLTDFGMAIHVGSVGVYKATKQIPMPVRWSALESLESKTWTTKSDVWSLAVVAWEIFTGAAPFHEIAELPLVDAVPMLRSGIRLEIPSEVPKDVAEVMRKSWDADPGKRPTAEQFRNVCIESRSQK